MVRLCAEARAPIVPQGGNTSMVGGATPAEGGSEFVLSTSRLTRVRDIDPLDLTMTIEAGVTLKAAQIAAAEAGCLLPLSISSEGSAQIGGVLATNAGGNNTVRYGNARDLVLGLEVVLSDGTVWNGLRKLHKDNTGYCLRQLFVGSEGTLGVITAAVLKLVPRPREVCVALCALASPDAALHLGPQHVLLERAATDVAQGRTGSDALQVESVHVMFLARGKAGPFRAEAEAMSGGDDSGRVGVQVVLHDEGNDDRAVTAATFVFRPAAG